MKLAPVEEVENCICEIVKLDEVENIVTNIIPEMVKLLKKERYGVGLAAPQVGIKKRFFIALNVETGKLDTYFNAFYIKNTDGKIYSKESCLTYGADKFARVKRYKAIKVIHEVYEDGKMIRKITPAKKVNAIILQHEIDHLSGRTIFN